MTIDQQIDRIFDMVDKWMKGGDFRQVNAYLASINYSIHLNLFDNTYEPTDAQIDLWLAALTITLPCRTKLNNRKMLFDFMGRFCEPEMLAGLDDF